MGLGYGPRVWDQGSAEDFLSGVVIFLPPQVNSLPPHLFSQLTCGGKEFTWGEELEKRILSIFSIFLAGLKIGWGSKVRCNTWGVKVRFNSAAKKHPSARPCMGLGNGTKIWAGV